MHMYSACKYKLCKERHDASRACMSDIPKHRRLSINAIPNINIGKHDVWWTLNALLNNVKWLSARNSYSTSQIYIAYLHQTNTIVFTFLSIGKQAKCNLPSSYIAQINLFSYVIYSSADLACQEHRPDKE